LKTTPEKAIQNAILDWLAAHRCLAWPTASVGLFDPTKKVYRRPGKHFRPGVSDILGIWLGWPLAIEVKAPRGKPTEAQERFLDDFRKAGGIGFVARSIDDVERELARWGTAG